MRSISDKLLIHLKAPACRLQSFKVTADRLPFFYRAWESRRYVWCREGQGYVKSLDTVYEGMTQGITTVTLLVELVRSGTENENPPK